MYTLCIGTSLTFYRRIPRLDVLGRQAMIFSILCVIVLIALGFYLYHIDHAKKDDSSIKKEDVSVKKPPQRKIGDRNRSLYDLKDNTPYYVPYRRPSTPARRSPQDDDSGIISPQQLLVVSILLSDDSAPPKQSLDDTPIRSDSDSGHSHSSSSSGSSYSSGSSGGGNSGDD
jgi:hypothetical protein